jgi:parvulin-like peptidyl-prolyl isomerase
MKLKIVSGLLLIIAIPCFADVKVNNDAALARVNGDAITVGDLLTAFTSRHGGHARFLGGNAEAREFLNLIIDDRLFLQEAYDIGLDQDAEVVQIVDEFAQRKAAEALAKSEIDEKVKPSDDEISAAWKALNVMLHVRQIAVDTREEAEEIRRAILQGADFETFARQCSRAQSRSRGGNLVVNWGQFGPEWEKVVFALAPGEIAPVFETPFGFEVVMLTDRADVELPPFDKVKGQIETVLRQRKTELRKKELSDELWRAYDVKVQTVDYSDPSAVIATWKGGQMTVGEVFEKGVAGLSPREIEQRLRSTVHSPLCTLAARDRKLAEAPELAKLIDEYRETLMKKALFRDHVFKDVAAGDDDVRAYYDAHKSEFIDAEQRHVAHIMVSTEKDAVAAREQLAGGADFEQIAKKMSRDFMTASAAGDLGWITPDKVPAAFKEVMRLGVGELSKPLKSPNGWHIIKVLEIKAPRQMALSEVQDKVRQRALEEKQRAARAFWRDRLRAAAKIDIDDAAIKAFVTANEFTAATPPKHAMQ